MDALTTAHRVHDEYSEFDPLLVHENNDAEFVRLLRGQAVEQNHLEPVPYFRALAIISTCLAIITLTLLIASYTIVLISPLGDTHGWTWYAAEAITGLWTVLLVVLAVSIIYFSVDCPAIVGAVVDAVLVGCVIAKLERFHDAYPSISLCLPYRDYPKYPRRPGDLPPPLIYPPPRCRDWKLALQILMGLAAGATLVIGYVLGLLPR